jgi:threonine/homoserine/homoserine lactone efflux protein
MMQPSKMRVPAGGCTLGIVPHLAAAVTGTAALLHTSGVAFEVVKFLGLAYLLLMACSTWRDRRALTIEDQSAGKPATKVITSAVLVNLLNPKLTLFFFAFLPQFIPGHAGGQLGAMLALSGVFMAMTLVVFAGYGLFAAAVREHLISSHGRGSCVGCARRLPSRLLPSGPSWPPPRDSAAGIQSALESGLASSHIRRTTGRWVPFPLLTPGRDRDDASAAARPRGGCSRGARRRPATRPARGTR